ncbi:hypothetical protein BKA62DRAFT_765054 [Auriculariales sp. MPI-PUGE-AT-0066]|nr:hypothetical protein BKA62DRAFT_765054 [Auriculariales sp. MPI-PUGE-AT-0066]
MDASNGENELLHLWALVVDLSDQLNQNRNLAATLQAQAGHIRSQAVHTGSGFPLRRFNAHLSVPDALSVDNSAIAHDNKQLAALIREYESTLEAVMAKFRAAALNAQEVELGIARHYENELITRDTQILVQQLAHTSDADAALSRVSQRLRAALRLSQGEPPLPDDVIDEAELASFQIPQELLEDLRDTYTGELPTDWALERESELVRLERENAELRRLLGAPPPEEDDGGMGLLPFRAPTLPRFRGRSGTGLGMYSPFQSNGGAGRGALAIGRMAGPGDSWTGENEMWRNVQERDTRAGLLS